MSREVVDQVRNALNPLDIIKDAVPSLKQAGNRWRGLCPFHNERTPSFYVMPEKGLWHCFGACNEGGDVFKFVMKTENMTFPEALRHLAAKAGVRVPERVSPAESREVQERERLLDLLAQAAAFYRDALIKNADAEPARRHLAQRKIRPETVDKFQLGFAPPRGGFLDQALRKGVPIEDLTRCGLASRSERTGRYNDPLWNRLIFPIIDVYGRVVGFGGRTLEDEAGPKYLNSPETPVYSKSRHLYGLHQGRASLRAKGLALLVEGYMDVIGCHQAGWDVAVAPLGTAFTKEQAQLLKRNVPEVVVLFDPDAAGERASWKSAQVFLEADLFVRVARLPGGPDGMDPDDFLLEHGAAALEPVVKGAQDAVDFWLDHLTDPNAQGLAQRVRQAEVLLDVVRTVPNEILRAEWTRKISRRLSLDESSLARELKKRSPSASRPAVPERRVSPAPMRSAEQEALQILCHHPEIWPSEGIESNLFAEARSRLVFEKLSAFHSAQKPVDLGAMLGDLAPEDSRWLSALLLEEKDFDKPAEALARCLAGLAQQAGARERRSLERDVLQMMQGALPRDEAKIARYKDLTRALKAPRESVVTN